MVAERSAAACLDPTPHNCQLAAFAAELLRQRILQLHGQYFDHWFGHDAAEPEPFTLPDYSSRD
jgi:hypothetical protein